MAQTGMSVPTYAYAANNPVSYIDTTGLGPEPNWADANLVRAIDRLQTTAEGRAIWKEAQARPESIFISSETAALILDPNDPGVAKYQWGRTPKRRGNQACYVDTNPDLEGGTSDPAAVLGHEIQHALNNLRKFNMSKNASEGKSLIRQMIIEMQLAK